MTAWVPAVVATPDPFQGVAMRVSKDRRRPVPPLRLAVRAATLWTINSRTAELMARGEADDCRTDDGSGGHRPAGRTATAPWWRGSTASRQLLVGGSRTTPLAPSTVSCMPVVIPSVAPCAHPPHPTAPGTSAPTARRDPHARRPAIRAASPAGRPTVPSRRGTGLPCRRRSAAPSPGQPRHHPQSGAETRRRTPSR